ncbi:MAG: SWIM zinc finger family protein [Merismopediaceae bacterium]|nr:SWIM zinc finger family protein [Merismopediaceae bacterium]
MTDYSHENRQWWVERWLELLDSYRFKKRLERARNYAREGHILCLEFEQSQVTAQVQGSEVEPYQVSLYLEAFSEEDWHYVVETLAEKAIYSAQLLAGQMPSAIEQVFIKNGLNLFPYNLTEIRSYCTCPDKANPCKHIAAVYYQIGDRLSSDPFVMLQLRGRSKTQLLAELQEQRNRQTQDNTPLSQPETAPTTALPLPEPAAQSPDSEPDFATFWHYDEPLDPELVLIVPPTDGKSCLDHLGLLPLPLEEALEVKQLLQPIYQTVSQQALLRAMTVGTS